jgi:hypothetical protein
MSAHEQDLDRAMVAEIALDELEELHKRTKCLSRAQQRALAVLRIADPFRGFIAEPMADRRDRMRAVRGKLQGLFPR